MRYVIAGAAGIILLAVGLSWLGIMAEEGRIPPQVFIGIGFIWFFCTTAYQRNPSAAVSTVVCFFLGAWAGKAMMAENSRFRVSSESKQVRFRASDGVFRDVFWQEPNDYRQGGLWFYEEDGQWVPILPDYDR